jgi:hypothetical protein
MDDVAADDDAGQRADAPDTDHGRGRSQAEVGG